MSWREDLHPRERDGRFGRGTVRVTSRTRNGPATTEHRTPQPATPAGDGGVTAVRSSSAGGPAWSGVGLRRTATVGGRELHLKRAGGVWSVFDGDPVHGRRVATAATITDAKTAAVAYATGQGVPRLHIPDAAGLARLDDTAAMTLYARAVLDDTGDPAGLARLDADLQRRDQLERQARARPAVTNLPALSDDDLDRVARHAAHTADESALSAVYAEMDRRYAAAEKARRRADAHAAPAEDAWLYGLDNERDWATQWAAETTAGDGPVDDALAAGAGLYDAYTVDLDAARAGQRGRTRDILRRRYDEMTALALLQAESATNGHLLNARGRAQHVDPLTLFSGPRAVADAYASEELQRHWGATGRVTFADFTEQAVAGAAANRRRRLEQSAGRQYA